MRENDGGKRTDSKESGKAVSRAVGEWTSGNRRVPKKQAEFVKRPAVAFACGVIGATALWLPCYERWTAAALSTRLLCLLTVCAAVAAVAGLVCLRLSHKKQLQTAAFLTAGMLLALVCSSFAMERMLLPACRMVGQTSAAQGIVEQAEVTDYGSRYQIRLQSAEGLPKGMHCLLYSLEEPAAQAGDTLSFSAEWRLEESKPLRSRRIFLSGWAQQGVQRVKAGKMPVQEYLRSTAAKLYRAPVLGLVEGILFGETQRLEQPFYRMMQDAGLAHILAVSGLHIGMSAAFFRTGLEKIGVCRRLAEWMLLLPVWGYIALTGFSPSAVRAGIMATLAGLGWVLGRERDGLSSLASAACLMLLASPYLLYSLSFLLSFWITMGLLLCASGLLRLWEQSALGAALIGRRGTPHFWRKLSNTACLSLAAGIFGMPVLLYHFHALSIWSVLAAVLSLWAVPWVMLFGLLSLAAMLLYQSVGIGLLLLIARALAGLTGLFVRWILLVGKAVSRLPAGVVYSNRLWLLLATLLIALGLALALRSFERMSRQRLRQRFGCWLAASLLCLFSVQTVQLLGQHRALYLYHTENALVLVRDGQAALVGDVCSAREASELVRLLRCEGIDRLELLLCTSPTTDDSAGIDLLLEEIDAKAAAVPQGNFTPHIQQALGGQMIFSKEGVGAQLLGDVQVQFDRNGVQLLAGDKKLLKTGRSYGIIEQDPNGWDAVLDSDGWQLRNQQDMTLVWTLEQQPALRVKL